MCGFEKNLFLLDVLVQCNSSLEALLDTCSIYQCFCIKYVARIGLVNTKL